MKLSGRIITADQARALSVRWQEFLTAHRAGIEAGKRWSLDHLDVTADLVPAGWTIYRTGKPNWPPR